MHKLVELGIKRYNERKTESLRHNYTSSESANAYFNNIESYPHLFVLSCLMDRRIDSDKAWQIPYNFCRDFNAFDMRSLSQLTREEISQWFTNNKPHWLNNPMATIFYDAIQRIHTEYQDDASKLWADNPKSSTFVARFSKFNGAGPKITSMAANILARDYGIAFEDYSSIDISVDDHVKHVFYQLGLTEDEDDIDSIIYKARELNSEYPGIIDFLCWETGKLYCHPTNPECDKCQLSACCPSKESPKPL